MEEWINSIGFKTSFDIHELNKSQTQHLISLIINQISLFKDNITYNDSEQ